MKALRWLVGMGTLLIGAGGFTLSFGKLNRIALIAGYGDKAWIYPAIVEGFTTLCTLAAFLRHGQRGAWYPWTVGGMAFAYSLWANAVPESVPVEIVRAVPVMCIPLSVHMFIIIAGLMDQAVKHREAEAARVEAERVEIPAYDTLADIFPTSPVPMDQAEPEVTPEPEQPEAAPVEVESVPADQPVKVKRVKREQATVTPTALAGRTTYLRLAESADTPEKREMFLKLAAGQSVK